MHIHNPHLRYKTGVATFVQLLGALSLIVLNNVVALIGACTDGSDCAITAMFSILFIIMTALWFLGVAAVGYTAEERRSRHFALILLGLELATIAVALGFATHPGNNLGLISALLIIAGASWISLMAWRIIRARGGRISATSRRRSRTDHPSS